MTQSTKATSSITPYLYYEDLARALPWITEKFGFHEREAETQRSSSGAISHCAVELNGGIVLMGAPGRPYRNPKHLGQPTQGLYVMVDDVNRHFEHARSAGATICSELEDAPYGDRRYEAEDLEGHRWFFAQKIK